MTVNCSLALQKALYEALTNDAELMAAVVGVFSHVPPHTAVPYIVIGEGRSFDWSTTTTRGWQIQPSIEIYSRERGTEEAMALVSQVKEILHDVALTLEDCHLVMFRFLGSDISRQDDGLTYRGTITFNALVQEGA